MILLKDIYKTFNKNTHFQKKLYEGLNLKINKGEFITVIGSNGAGKSTLLKVLSNDLDIDSGKILFGEKETTNQKSFETAKNISYIMQDPSANTLGAMTVYENLSMSELKGKKAVLKKCLIDKNKDKYKMLLSKFNLGLENKLDIDVSLLSGGQRQALAIVMATLKLPQILLLDEHTAALDPITSKEVMKITDNIIKENNLTCLMITHKIQDAIDYGNRLIMIHDGKVLFDISREKKEKLKLQDIIEKFQIMKTDIVGSEIF